MNVVLTNIGNLGNKGTEALAKATIRGILTLDPGARFTLLTGAPHYDKYFMEEAFHGKVRCLKTPPFLGSTSIPRPLAHLLNAYPLVHRLPLFPRLAWFEAALETIRESDLVVCSGGDVFSSEYGDLHDHLRPIMLARRFRKKAILLGHSVGPFKRESERQLFYNVCKDVPFITLREARSFDYVRKLLGREQGIHLTADVAFTMAPVPPLSVERLRNLYQIPNHGNVIGLAVSQGITGFAGTDTISHYDTLRSTVEHLVQAGHHVVLIPHDQEQFTKLDDRLLVSTLARDLGFVSAISPITGDHTAEELKGIIGLCTVLVAERTHAAIAGMSQGVPTLNVAYSVKAYGITDSLYGDAADLYRVHVKDLSTSLIMERINYLLQNRDQISSQLRSGMQTVGKMAEDNFRLLSQFIGDCAPAPSM